MGFLILDVTLSDLPKLKKDLSGLYAPNKTTIKKKRKRKPCHEQFYKAPVQYNKTMRGPIISVPKARGGLN